MRIHENEFLKTEERHGRFTLHRVSVIDYIRLAVIHESILENQDDKVRLEMLYREFLKIVTGKRRFPRSKIQSLFEAAYRLNIPQFSQPENGKKGAKSKENESPVLSIMEMVERVNAETKIPPKDIFREWNIFQLMIWLELADRRKARENAEWVRVISGAQYAPGDTVERYNKLSRGIISQKMRVSDLFEEFGL